MTRRPLRALVLYAVDEQSRTLAYQLGWPRHFVVHPAFDCVAVNVARGMRGSAAAWAGIRRARVDVVVLLHSVFSNEQRLRNPLLRTVARMRQPKAVFLGNEYKLMPEKVAFVEALGADVLVSQLSSSKAHDLYRARLGCAVVGLPNAPLDTELFAPRTPRAARPVDLGYRAFDAPYSLGNRERQVLALDVARRLEGWGLATDVSLDPSRRLGEREWAAFLARCKGQLGSEAGGDYFELTDETRTRVNAYLEERPHADFDDVFARFFRDYPDPVSGRALSGRIVEAAGTKTVQVLLEGEYGGYFRPGEHYIPVRHDLSNLDAAVETFLDVPMADAIAQAAYEVATAELTYARLIDRFADALEAVL